VLLACTETYLRRVDSEEEPGVGHGVLWEGRLIKQHLYDASSVSSKFVPIVFDDGPHNHVPTPMRGASIFRIETGDGYEALYRLLTNQPRVRKPQIGKLLSLPERQRQWVGLPSTGVERGHGVAELAGEKTNRVPAAEAADEDHSDLAVFRDAPFAPELVVIPRRPIHDGLARGRRRTL
jgi:hypothetical protein